MLLTKKEIINNPEKHIKLMCYNILISNDNQAFTLSFKPLKQRLIGGSYCYYINGRYRTMTWIYSNAVNVSGFIYND